MRQYPTTTRRDWIVVAASSVALAGTQPAWAQARRTVTVVTSYPEDMSARFAAAFEKAHPAWRLQVVWLGANDALPWLSAPDHHGADVYWAASPRTFSALQQAGALRRLDIDRAALPDQIGGTRLSDANGHFAATEVAGYGFAFHPGRLSAKRLKVPKDWPDLATAGWHGQLVMPTPARVAFAPVVVDIVLRAFGWERGWALWSAIAGNAALVGNGNTVITDEVSSGRRALGLTIDFYAMQAIASGAPMRFTYPAHGGVNPAHIAIMAKAPQADGARAFVQFVLSKEGQALLTEPDLRRLPVRPSAYARLPAGYYNPFNVAKAGGLDYDHRAGQPRLSLITALFQQCFVADHAEHTALWRRLHAAEAAGKRVAAARQALERVPVDAAQAGQAALLSRYRRVNGNPRADVSGLEAEWRAAAAQQRREAAAALS